MGKIVKSFIFLVLTSLSLWADSSYMKQLEQYDTQMKSASKDDRSRIYHGIHSIYIQSIISGDNALKEESLTRLIKSAKELNMNTSKYEAELKTLQKTQSKSTKSQTPKTFKVEDDSSSTKEEPEVKQQTTSRIDNDKSSSSKSRNILKTATSEKDVMVFVFSNPVDAQKVKILGLNNGKAGYKKIIDVPGIMLGSKVSSPKPIGSIQDIHINQYNSDTIRIVLDTEKPFDLYAGTNNERLFLSLSKNFTMPPASSTKEPKNTAQKLLESSSSKDKDDEPVVAVPTKTKNPRVIVIDAGHGGKDLGAIGYKNRAEKNLVLDVALQLGKALEQRGHKVLYTRKKDVFINLRDRTKEANNKNAHLFISLHANAAPNEAKKNALKGMETFFLSPDRSDRSKSVVALENQSDVEEMAFYSKETFLNTLNREKIILSNKAAIDIHSGMLKNARKQYAAEDGGVREAPFWVLVGATMPSVLVELGYITNPEECEHMFNPEYQKLLVKGISDGVERYFINNP